MGVPSVSYSFTTGTQIYLSQLNTNFGDLVNHTAGGVTSINVNSITAAGALEVRSQVVFGNASTDTVTMPGAMTINGTIAGQRNLYTIVCTNIEDSDQYIPGQQTPPAARNGAIMPYSGSVIGFSVLSQLNSIGGNSTTAEFRLRRNGTTLVSSTIRTMVSIATTYTDYMTMSKGAHTFSTGAELEVFYHHAGGTSSMTNFMCLVEVYFST